MGNETSQQALGEPLPNNVKMTVRKLNAGSAPKRDGHCAAAIGDSLYIFGGVEQAEDGVCTESNQLYRFDTKSCDNNWKCVQGSGDLPSARVGATMSSVGKKLYLIGGLNETETWVADVHCFDTENSTWSVLELAGKGPSARDKASAAVIGSNIYIFGGFGPKMPDVEDDESDEDNDDLPDDQEAANFGWFDDLYILDTEKNTWSNPMHANLEKPTARAACGICAIDKYLVIFGGKDMKSRRNDLYIFDTVERKWQTDLKITGRLPEPRSFHSFTAVGERAVLIGGIDTKDHIHADVHVFNPRTRQWLQPKLLGAELVGRHRHSATLVGDKLVIHGGSGLDEETESLQSYNDTLWIHTDDILFKNPTKGTNNGTSLKRKPDDENEASTSKRVALDEK